MNCKVCGNHLVGRSDKIFCCLPCKNAYHTRLRRITNIAAKKTDKILHRNRSILYEVIGKKRKKIKLHRSVLDKKKFNFSYITGIHINIHGKQVNHIYDFSWIIFSDEEVLINRK